MNAWLKASPENRPRGVSEMTVRFEPARLVARGLFDLSLVKSRMNVNPWNPLYWINGIVPVDVSGRVESQNGEATVHWDEVKVASVPVSPTGVRDARHQALPGRFRHHRALPHAVRGQTPAAGRLPRPPGVLKPES
jgi:hypothetical protein